MYMTQPLHRLLQQDPDRLATVFGDRRHTYRHFSRRVARLAAGLRAQGLQTGDRVGMLALNSDHYLEFMYATWWAGAVLNPVNIRWSVPEIVYSLDDSDTRILFIDDAFLRMADGILAGAKNKPILIYAGDGEAPANMPSLDQMVSDHQPVKDALRGGNDLAAIMYTGGTTGLPKGVMQSHMNLWSSAVSRAAQFPGLPDSRTLHAAPLFHTAAMARAVGQFVVGETSVLVPMFDAVNVMRTIEREQVSEILLVPTMLQAVIDHPDFASYDLRCLRRVAYGASPISQAVLERAIAAFPQADFLHAYGMTEASPVISVSPASTHTPENIASGLVRTVGRGGYFGLVRIVDDEGNEVPRGTVGEIVVCGPNVMLGYWNRPEETAKALRSGWLHTGDGAYMDEKGYIFIVDRIKDMIVSGGENVYSAEVENAIATHPDVAQVAVIGVPHDKWGEAVHAVVVPHAGRALTEAEVRTHCASRIAGFKCPKTVEFRNAMPLSAAGKILKRDLREPYWKGRERAVN